MATTSTAGTPKTYRQLADGCERQLGCFEVLDEGRALEALASNWNKSLELCCASSPI
jgi:hypothetical protein